MGFAGTMGADWIDYLITDYTVTPDRCFDLYTEKIARMPHSYFVNDHKQTYPPAFDPSELATREMLGLPQGLRCGRWDTVGSRTRGRGSVVESPCTVGGGGGYPPWTPPPAPKTKVTKAGKTNFTHWETRLPRAISCILCSLLYRCLSCYFILFCDPLLP